METDVEQERKAELIQELQQYIPRLKSMIEKKKSERSKHGANDDRIGKLEALLRMISPSNNFKRYS